jgi:hypothetical protein
MCSHLTKASHSKLRLQATDKQKMVRSLLQALHASNLWFTKLRVYELIALDERDA